MVPIPESALVATGHISVRSIADAIGCTIGSDRLKDGDMRPIPQGNDRSQVATETKDSAIGRRVVFSRDQADRSMAISEESKILRYDRGPIKRVPIDLNLEGFNQKSMGNNILYSN